MDAVVPFNHEITTDGPTDIGTINVNEIEFIIGGNLTSITGLNAIIRVLLKIAPFKALGSTSLTQIAKKFESIVISDDTIFEEGDVGDSLYIVPEGNVVIYKENVLIRRVHEESYFGERAIIMNEPRSATVKAEGEVALLRLSQKDFLTVIDEHIRQILIHRIHMQDDSVDIEDLQIC